MIGGSFRVCDLCGVYECLCVPIMLPGARTSHPTTCAADCTHACSRAHDRLQRWILHIAATTKGSPALNFCGDPSLDALGLAGEGASISRERSSSPDAADGCDRYQRQLSSDMYRSKGSSVNDESGSAGTRGGGGFIKSLMVMIKGMNSLFWTDLNACQRRFEGVFCFVVARLTDDRHSIDDRGAVVYGEVRGSPSSLLAVCENYLNMDTAEIRIYVGMQVCMYVFMHAHMYSCMCVYACMY